MQRWLPVFLGIAGGAVLLVLASRGLVFQSLPEPERAWEADVRFSLNLLTRTSPRKLARQRAGKGDYRLMGFMSYAVSIPGLPAKRYDELLDRHEVWILPGTGDFILSREMEVLMQQAPGYARSFNREMIRLGDQAFGAD